MNTEKLLKYYVSTPNFKIENPNPRAAKKRGYLWDTPDCVIRALCNSTGCSWLQAFDYLTEQARKEYTIPNDGRRFRDWIKSSGAIWTPCKAVKGKKRMTCLEFAKAHKTGRYIISVANHETACVDGVILDTWNCGDKAVVGYFDMAEFKIPNGV